MFRWLSRGMLLAVLLVQVQITTAAEAKTALVTGANRGIGLEFAKQLTERGFTVIGTARQPEEAADLKALGARVLQLDVTDSASVAAMASALDGVAIDLLINNAGIVGHVAGSIVETDWDQIGMTLEVNAIGPMRVTQALLPNLLAGNGKTIVQITSIMGSIKANPGNYHGYSASKAALNMLNSLLAKELAGEGVTAVVIHPGWVKTRLGGEGAQITRDESVAGMLEVIDHLTPAKTGRFFDYKGREMPW